MIDGLDRTLGRVSRAYLLVAQLLLAGLIALVGTEVVLRYATSRSILGLEEITAVAFVWIVFLMAAVLHRRKRHIAITAAVELLPAAARAWCDLVVEAAAIVFCVAVFLRLHDVWPFLMRTSPIFGIPETAFKIALAVGMGTILAQEVVNLGRTLARLAGRG